jgi:hypothetical protein
MRPYRKQHQQQQQRDGRRRRGIPMLKKLTMIVAATFAASAYAGEWHAGENNLCTDCHTMHFSMNHNWDGTTPVATTPQKDGNWLSATGPNHYLLKAPANELCKA